MKRAPRGVAFPEPSLRNVRRLINRKRKISGSAVAFCASIQAQGRMDNADPRRVRLRKPLRRPAIQADDTKRPVVRRPKIRAPGRSSGARLALQRVKLKPSSLFQPAISGTSDCSLRQRSGGRLRKLRGHRRWAIAEAGRAGEIARRARAHSARFAAPTLRVNAIPASDVERRRRAARRWQTSRHFRRSHAAKGPWRAGRP